MAEIGDVIKSYDFRERTDSYMIGEVLSKRDGLLHCRTTLHVVINKVREIDEMTEFFDTPDQACLMGDEDYFEARVEVLTEDN